MPDGTISHPLLHSAFTPLFLDAFLKSLAVLAVAGGLCWVRRRAAAATRHWIWLLALASLPCLLLLAALPHRGNGHCGPSRRGQFRQPGFAGAQPGAKPRGQKCGGGGCACGTTAAVTRTENLPSRAPLSARFSTTWLVVAVVVWVLGTLCGLVSMLRGAGAAGRLTRDAHVVRDADWALLLSEACERLGLRRPVTCCSRRAT